MEVTAVFFNGMTMKKLFDGRIKALIEARNKIRKKDKTIAELKKTITELRSELVKNEDTEEDIINSFLKL